MAAKQKKNDTAGARITERHRKALDIIKATYGASESMVICDLLDALATTIENNGPPLRPYVLHSSKLYILPPPNELAVAETSPPPAKDPQLQQFLSEINSLARRYLAPPPSTPSESK